MSSSTVIHHRVPWLFLLGQLLVLAALAALGLGGSREFQRVWQLPPLRDEPLSLQPLYNYDVVVTDEQLRRAVLRLRPRLEGAKTMIANVDHALRFCGAAAQFEDPEFASGTELRRLLTDHRRFVELYGPEQPPLLIDKGPGVGVRVKEGLASSSHTDHTAACLADAGTPLTFPVITPQGEKTYRDMVEQALRDFDINQDEYEWTAKLCMAFLPPTLRWRTKDGQSLSFDRLADRILRDPLPHGVCWGSHRLFALAGLLRVDEQLPLLSADTRQRIYEFLDDATRRLVQHQHRDGFWNDRWATATPASREPTPRDGDQLGDRILVTGHALEWWASAPEQVHPPRPVLALAGQWLVRTLDGMSDEEVQQNYAFLSHAVRALALWRGCEPADILRETSGRRS